MNRLGVSLAATGLVVGVIAMGCGTSDEETLTKAEVIQQGDAICAKIDKQQLTGIRSFSKRFQQTAIGRKGQEMMARAVMLPSVQREAEELDELAASSSRDQEQLEAFVQAIEDDLSRVEKNLNLLEEAAGSPFARSEKLAKRYGFKTCIDVL